MNYRGGCHCGRVRFEVDSEIESVSECNCTVCSKKAYLHWMVPPERFRLLTSRDDLATYTFNTGAAKHYFCRTCGVASFYIPRSDPDKIDVNLRCVEGIDLSSLKISNFDGQNWEQAFLEERGALAKDPK
jgi:hypothetical protein